MKESSLLKKQPKAYAEGFCDFYGRDFIVSPKVLIPRPETEAIIDEVLALVGRPYLPGVVADEPRFDFKDNLRILDVGTGSGCVGITLALEIPEVKVLSVDISLEALKIAKENAKRFAATQRIGFRKSDLMADTDGDFDIIVANLPYVDRVWDWLDLEALSFEPEVALFAEDGGCALIFELIRQARGRCKFLVLEADPSQHERIIEFAKEQGFVLDRTRGFILSFRNSFLRASN